jgi:hypothetical protein
MKLQFIKNEFPFCQMPFKLFCLQFSLRSCISVRLCKHLSKTKSYSFRNNLASSLLFRVVFLILSNLYHFNLTSLVFFIKSCYLNSVLPKLIFYLLSLNNHILLSFLKHLIISYLLLIFLPSLYLLYYHYNCLFFLLTIIEQ